jgi:hypothetical protein
MTYVMLRTREFYFLSIVKLPFNLLRFTVGINIDAKVFA